MLLPDQFLQSHKFADLTSASALMTEAPHVLASLASLPGSHFCGCRETWRKEKGEVVQQSYIYVYVWFPVLVRQRDMNPVKPFANHSTRGARSHTSTSRPSLVEVVEMDVPSMIL